MRKRLAIVLTLLLGAAAVAAACSTGGETPGQQPAGSGAANAGQSASGSESKPDYGKVYVYANYGHLNLATDMSKKDALEEVRQYIKEQSGVEVMEIVPPKGSEAERLNLLLAGNEPLDLYTGSMDVHQANGAAHPLNKLIEDYGPHIKALWPAEWSDASWKALQTEDGELWAIPVSPPMSGSAVTMRKDWLEELGLSVPTTLEQYEQVLLAFKENDPAGNGETIPLLTDFNGMNDTLAGLFMETAYGDWIDAEGRVRPSVQHPGYEQFLVKMADWYKKGLIYRESFSSDDTRQRDLAKANRVGSAAAWHSRTMGHTDDIRTIDPDAEYVVADLQGPEGYGRKQGGVSRGGTLLSKNAQNPEGAIRYLDWLHADVSNYLTAFYGIPGKHWEWVDREKGTFKRLNKDYAGEFMTGFSFAMTVQFSEDNPQSVDRWVRPFYATYLVEKVNIKKEGTAEYKHQFDFKKINEQVPMLADIERMISQEVTKFVMGARPMSQYPNFLEELEKVGIGKWIEAHTEEYNKFVKP